MFEKLDVFRLAHAMARHAGAGQAVTAQNIANADTPGYAARSVTPFAEMVQAGSLGPSQALRATRAGHLDFGRDAGGAVVVDTRGAPADPNGNNVSLEAEMLNAVAVKRQHDRALAIYKSSMNILRTSVSRR